MSILNVNVGYGIVGYGIGCAVVFSQLSRMQPYIERQVDAYNPNTLTKKIHVVTFQLFMEIAAVVMHYMLLKIGICFTVNVLHGVLAGILITSDSFINTRWNERRRSENELTDTLAMNSIVFIGIPTTACFGFPFICTIAAVGCTRNVCELINSAYQKPITHPE